MKDQDETRTEYEDLENQPLKEPIRPRPACAVARRRRERARGQRWLRRGWGRGNRRVDMLGTVSAACRAGKGDRHA